MPTNAGCRHRKAFDRAAIDRRLGSGHNIAQKIDTATLQVLHRGTSTAIRHVRKLKPKKIIHQYAAKMRRGASPGRAELHLCLMLLGISDELLEVVDRKVLARDQHEWHFGNQNDWGEIGHSIVERLLVESLSLCGAAHSCEDELIAVGIRPGDARGAGHPARTRDILDHDLLA